MHLSYKSATGLDAQMHFRLVNLKPAAILEIARRGRREHTCPRRVLLIWSFVRFHGQMLRRGRQQMAMGKISKFLPFSHGNFVWRNDRGRRGRARRRGSDKRYLFTR